MAGRESRSRVSIPAARPRSYEASARAWVELGRLDHFIAALARRGASQIRDRDDPGGAGQDHRLTTFRTALCGPIRAGQEQHRKYPVDDMEHASARRMPGDVQGEAEQTLDGCEAGHDQVARTEPTADACVAKVAVCAPQPEQNREGDQRPRAEAVKKDERVRQLVGTQHLVTEVFDSLAQAFLEIDLRLPIEIVARTRVVEGDPEDVAFAPRSEVRFELVVGEDRELAVDLVYRRRDARADVVRAARASIQGVDVRNRHVC